MYRIYNKILYLDEGDFKIIVKSGMFWKKCHGSFQGASLKMREITCMKYCLHIFQLFELLGFDRFELIQSLLQNREKLLFETIESENKPTINSSEFLNVLTS